MLSFDLCHCSSGAVQAFSVLSVYIWLTMPLDNAAAYIHAIVKKVSFSGGLTCQAMEYEQ